MPGHHWSVRRWRVLPGGTRDYAVYHGLDGFPTLVRDSARTWRPGMPRFPFWTTLAGWAGDQRDAGNRDNHSNKREHR